MALKWKHLNKVIILLNEIQILCGGAHADWATDIQDYLVIAIVAKTYEETLEMTYNIYHVAGEFMKKRRKGKSNWLRSRGKRVSCLEVNLDLTSRL